MRLLHSESHDRQRRLTSRGTGRQRRGSVLVLVTLLAIPMLAMAALAIDYGYLLKTKSDLQRVADAAALASVQNLVPRANGTQDLDAVRATLRSYVRTNSNQSFEVLDADIEIGRYDPATIYSTVTLLNSGVFDCVRVTVRRDANANSRVGLFLAPLLGMRDAAVTATATAVLQKAAILQPGADVLPFSVPQSTWDAQPIGKNWSIYGDGKMANDQGSPIPGNWGTVDIGNTNDSTSDINDQILHGLRQSDLNALSADGRISGNSQLDARVPVSLQGDPGLSSGLKSSVEAINGQFRIVPIYDTNSGGGGNTLDVHVVKWGIVKVIDSNWAGANNTYVTIAKSYAYEGELRPNPNLSSTSASIEGAYTSPMLVQ